MIRALAVAALLAGCGEITVTALTPPPPGKTAVLDGEDLDLSRGIALAFECVASNDDYNGPCRDATATSSDPGVARVFPSYLDTLAPAWKGGGAGGPRSRTAFVVIGLAEGTSEVRVETSDGDVSIDVSVSW